MAFLQTRVSGPSTLLTTSSSVVAPSSYLYAVGTGETTVIKQLILTNFTSSAKTVTIWLKKADIAISTADIIFHDFVVNANETTLVNLSLVMGYGSAEGDAIYARASSASSVNVVINAVVENGA